jgi:hypothetical protein
MNLVALLVGISGSRCGRSIVAASQSSKVVNTVVKVALDQGIGAPLYIYSYYVLTNLGQTMQNTVLVGWSGYLSHLNNGGLMRPDEEVKVAIVRRETHERLLQSEVAIVRRETSHAVKNKEVTSPTVGSKGDILYRYQ